MKMTEIISEREQKQERILHIAKNIIDCQKALNKAVDDLLSEIIHDCED